MSKVTKNKVIKEIEDFDLNYKTTISHANLDYLFRNIEAQRQEIERLNNIINELEKYINEEYIYDELGMKIFDASKLQDKLQELKGDVKDE